MSLPLLATKYNLPPVHPNLVRRERLLNLLDEGILSGHLLTLICAPTGYGKTTLVSQWVHQHKKENPRAALAARSFAWLTLEQGDNDLARFIAYLVAALQPLHANLGQGLLAALQNVRSISPHVLATLLINDLSVLADHSILILEDYHTIIASPIQDFMSYLIDHQPMQMHLVIITRADPPLPLARLRARNQLTEIRQLDLALTRAESSEFLVQIMRMDLSPEQVQVLESRTEGWVAGLQLAALSMRHINNIAAFIQVFSGGHEFIADYLTGEVLEQQNDATKSFLLQTSILNQLSAPLCEAVTGQAPTAQILQQLIDANLFIVPLDYNGDWYRYHALFADMLRKRLQQSNKESVMDLHNRAGRWYAQNKMLDQAVEHFLAGQDYDGAAKLIEENAERILMHGQKATFFRWLDAFPMDQLYAHPVLVVYQGMAMILLGKIPENALSMLQDIASSAEEFRGEADTLQALLSVMKGNALEAIRLSESALRRLPAEHAFLRIMAADCLAMAHALRGDVTSAAQAFEKVVEVAQKAGNVIMMLSALTNLAGLRYQQGHLHQVWDDYQQVLEISKECLGERSQAMGRALLGMGELAREWNDLEAACNYLSKAAEMFKEFLDIGVTVAYLSLARVYFSQGEWDKAQEVLVDARQHSQATKNTAIDDSLTELMQARVWIALGELDRAELWARKCGVVDNPLVDLVNLADHSATAFELIQKDYLTFVRLLLAQNRPQKVMDILEVLLTYNEKKAQMRIVIEILILQAIAYQLQGADEPAMLVFSKALTLAEPEGYMRTFLDEGQPVTRLLYQAISAGFSTTYCSNILAGISELGPLSPAPRVKSGAVQELVEPLSKRELDVLGLIAEGLANQEIAARLHISLSTVKGHTAHIFGKLGVKSRTQAVALAQSKGFIP